MQTAVSEIMSSIQGEGIYVGRRQVFIRFPGCNISCCYCDTPVLPPAFCRVETLPGEGKFQLVPNPLGIAEIIKIITQFNLDVHHSISLTGGEPLLHSNFLKLFLRELQQTKIKVFLETNGLLYDNLQEIIDLLDIISMDIKLPSAVNREFWNEHRLFLQKAKAKDVYVKVVITSATSIDEIKQVCQLLVGVDPKIPLILQPVTPVMKGEQGVSPKQLFIIHEVAAAALEDIRIIPQTHRMMGIL